MSIDDELLQDDQETQREVDFIRRSLPQDSKDALSDKQLRWVIYTIADYYVESGLLDSDDEEVDIDMEQVAAHVLKQAAQEGIALDADPILMRLIAEADLDFYA